MYGTAASEPVHGLGCAGLNTVSERKPYKTGLSDEQWALIAPVIAAWKSATTAVPVITKEDSSVRWALPNGVARLRGWRGV